MPFFSVVIPAFNEEKFLPNCLKSLKEQDFKDFEIIVVNNNSIDKTAKIAKEFGARVIFEKIKEWHLQDKEDFWRQEGKLLLPLMLIQFCQKIGYLKFLKNLKKTRI